MKKFSALLLTLIMLLSMGSVAFAIDAAPAPVYIDQTTVGLSKVYKLINDGKASPAETFSFTVENVSVTDSPYTLATMPSFASSTYSIPFIEGAATLTGLKNTIAVNLPTYASVGIFTYKFTETAGDTAGVIYDSNPLYLKVTVIEQNGKIRVVALHYATADGVKTDNITNTYSAGSLAVSKTVTGNLGDKSKFFDVVVTLLAPTAPAKVVRSTIGITGGSHASNPTSIVIGTPTTFKLKDGETITFDNLPYGVTYTVAENSYVAEGYTTNHVFSDAGKLINSPADTVTITNDKDVTVDTGISLDSLPYILMLSAAILGMGVLFFRKRQKANF